MGPRAHPGSRVFQVDEEKIRETEMSQYWRGIIKSVNHDIESGRGFKKQVRASDGKEGTGTVSRGRVPAGSLSPSL